MSSMDGGAVELRGYGPADAPAVLEVLQAAFGAWPQGIEGVDPTEFFRWKLDECPFGPQMSVVAEVDGGLVGFTGQLTWPFRHRGRTIEAIRGMDLAVHPSQRGRGISLMITRAAMERNAARGVAMTWNNPNDQSRPGLLKLGRGVVVLPRFAAPRWTIGRTIGRALGKGSRTPEDLQIEAGTAGEVLRDGDYVARVLSAVKEPDDRLVTARDLDYLRWRYGRFGLYRAFRADPDMDAAGIVIFRPRRSGSFWVAEICELLVAGNDQRSARRLLGKVRRAAGTDLLGANFNSRREAARCGFVRVRGGSLLTVRAIQSDLPDIAHPDSWGLSYGDIELI